MPNEKHLSLPIRRGGKQYENTEVKRRDCDAHFDACNRGPVGCRCRRMQGMQPPGRIEASKAEWRLLPYHCSQSFTPSLGRANCKTLKVDRATFLNEQGYMIKTEIQHNAATRRIESRLFLRVPPDRKRVGHAGQTPAIRSGGVPPAN